MKKLMIAAAIVCAAALSQAATASWGVGASNIYDGKGTSAAKVAQNTIVYMFDAKAVVGSITGKSAQQIVFEAFAADVAHFDATDVTGYAASVKTSAAGVMSNTTVSFAYGEQTVDAENPNHYDFFFAIVKDDTMYLSKTVGANAGATSTAVPLAYGNQSPTDGSATSKSLPTQGFVAAGQWAQVVPEPTSGLLLLLGVAGLALRRRRA